MTCFSRHLEHRIKIIYMRLVHALPLFFAAVARTAVDMELTFATFDEAVFRSNRSAAFIEFCAFATLQQKNSPPI